MFRVIVVVIVAEALIPNLCWEPENLWGELEMVGWLEVGMEFWVAIWWGILWGGIDESEWGEGREIWERIQGNGGDSRELKDTFRDSEGTLRGSDGKFVVFDGKLDRSWKLIAEV
jgi:hypothetical protein